SPRPIFTILTLGRVGTGVARAGACARRREQVGGKVVAPVVVGPAVDGATVGRTTRRRAAGPRLVVAAPAGLAPGAGCIGLAGPVGVLRTPGVVAAIATAASAAAAPPAPPAAVSPAVLAIARAASFTASFTVGNAGATGLVLALLDAVVVAAVIVAVVPPTLGALLAFAATETFVAFVAFGPWGGRQARFCIFGAGRHPAGRRGRSRGRGGSRRPGNAELVRQRVPARLGGGRGGTGTLRFGTRWRGGPRRRGRARRRFPAGGAGSERIGQRIPGVVRLIGHLWVPKNGRS
ncbi:MAG: hypothetical protein ACK5SI_14170, partial [Planctomycetia bacterium]